MSAQAAFPDIGQILDWLRVRVAAGADLHLDSRQVAAGDVFVACAGLRTDGRLYIEQALARGAAAVLCEAGSDAAPPEGAPVLVVQSLRSALGELADAWYGRPSAALSVVAVTGTNGKTSCTQWIAGALTRLGRPCGSIGTLGAFLPDGAVLGDTLTTPDVLSTHRLLARMRAAGAAAVALEASSIGLEQGRLDGVRVAVAGYTNFTRDHLDYHGTMQAYEASKARLFGMPDLGAAVLNVDDAAVARLGDSLPAGLATSCSLRADSAADVTARAIQATPDGQVFTLRTSEGEAQIVTHLLGRHNVANLLLVAGVLSRLGVSLGDIARALSLAGPVAGRLEAVDVSALSDEPVRGALAVVDYAHTPDALAGALTALRSVAQARGGRLVCLFGCGGGRDAGKRPEMGRIAAELADLVIVTSDNPRDEAPDAIIAQILAGMPDSARPVVEADRARAILGALWRCAPEDVVLLAGKGHETYQEIAGERRPFDDREWARLGLLLPRAKALSTDTRRIGRGELFLALAGDNFDGHDYLAQAQAAGACAAIVAHRVADSDLPQIVLGDTRQALGRIGAAWRANFSLPVVAVTGSNGKTTTKEMVAAVLAAWQGAPHRLATAGNFNNDIGVPLTLLRLRPEHKAAVFELGMNHPGEIAVLAEIAAPTVAVVTNAQREHQEFMHSVEAVAAENGSVFAALPVDGVAVYPGDEPYASIWEDLAGGRRTLRFGLEPGLDVSARDIAYDASGTTCSVVTPMGVGRLALPVPGRHNLRNALAATACGLAAGVPLSLALQALAGFQAVSGRMQRKVLDDGTLLIDDTYNANPDSVRAAIDVLANLPAPRTLVLGDMGEVGENGPAMHEEVGAYARERGIEALLTLGEASRESASAFGEGARPCGSVEEIVEALLGLGPRSVLVKGSRFMRMERVVQAFSTNNNRPEGQGDRHAA